MNKEISKAPALDEIESKDCPKEIVRVYIDPQILLDEREENNENNNYFQDEFVIPDSSSYELYLQVLDELEEENLSAMNNNPNKKTYNPDYVQDDGVKQYENYIYCMEKLVEKFDKTEVAHK